MHVVMDARAIEDRCLKTNKFFGRATGIWPGQHKHAKYIIRLIIFASIVISSLAQIASVAISYSFIVLTDQLPFLLLGFGTFLKLYNYVVNEDKLKELLGGIVKDQLADIPKEESMILTEFVKKALFFSFIYKISSTSCTSTFIMLPFVPYVMDIFVPLNESRSRVLIYPAYFFVDEEKYYYVLVSFQIFTALIVACTFIGCDVNLVCTVHHACSLLTISGYRFEHAIDETYIYNEKNAHALADKCYKKVCQSIEAHQKAIEYVNKIEDCHVKCLFLSVGMIILAFTVTFVKVTTMEISALYFTFCGFIIAQLIHVFFLTVMGQMVIDSNNTTTEKIYRGLWYNGSTRTQLLYALVLRKCLTPPKLTGGGLIALNLTTFVQILKASFSYYGILKSV